MLTAPITKKKQSAIARSFQSAKALYLLKLACAGIDKSNATMNIAADIPE